MTVLRCPDVLQPDPATSQVQPEPPTSRHRRWVFAFAAVMSARMLGLALLPMLLVEAPVVLLASSPILAHLVLTAALLPTWLYFVVGIATSIVQNSLAYGFGVVLGVRATVWLEGQGEGTHAATTRVLRWMQIAAPAVLIAMAGPPIAALAGVAKVRVGVFAVAMVVSQFLWVGVCWWFGAAVTEQITLARGFVAEHIIELSALTLALVGGRALRRRHRRRRALEL